MSHWDTRPDRRRQLTVDVHRDAAAFTTNAVSPEQRVAGDISKVIGVSLFQMCLGYNSDVYVVTNQVS